jgi:hypothetical protein
MKTIWYTLLFICFSIQSSSQVDAQLQEKYSNFRERFKKEFIVIGDGQGMSIPVERRVKLQYADFACSITGIDVIPSICSFRYILYRSRCTKSYWEKTG